MQDQKNQKILTIFLIIVIILVICGGVFAFLDIKTKKEKVSLQTHVDILQNQNKILEEQLGKLENKLQDLQEGKDSTQKSSSCASTLTTLDKETIINWKTFNNAKYKFTFKYPETWQTMVNTDNLIELRDKELDLNLKFAAQMSSVDIEELYKKDEEKSTKVACENATQSSFSTQSNRLITVNFTKLGTPFAIIIGYKYSGASVSGDIIEAFNLILKTVEFK